MTNMKGRIMQGKSNKHCKKKYIIMMCRKQQDSTQEEGQKLHFLRGTAWRLRVNKGVTRRSARDCAERETSTSSYQADRLSLGKEEACIFFWDHWKLGRTQERLLNGGDDLGMR